MYAERHLHFSPPFSTEEPARFLLNFGLVFPLADRLSEAFSRQKKEAVCGNTRLL
jgi:hypothetical protein